jgi:hypothetical protein
MTRKIRKPEPERETSDIWDNLRRERYKHRRKEIEERVKTQFVVLSWVCYVNDGKVDSTYEKNDDGWQIMLDSYTTWLDLESARQEAYMIVDAYSDLDYLSDKNVVQLSRRRARWREAIDLGACLRETLHTKKVTIDVHIAICEIHPEDKVKKTRARSRSS